MTVDLIVAVDDKLADKQATQMSSRAKRQRMKELLRHTCKNLQGLKVPQRDGRNRPVQIKLNSIARALGYESLEIVQDAGLDLFLDWKLGPDVLDTMLADVRGISGYMHIQRFTFRVEAQVEFLTGQQGEVGACELMPHTSFLPVGPVTDLSEDYYRNRMGISGGRPDAVRNFCEDVGHFGRHVSEVICGPADIQHFPQDFLRSHKPITPAVRPAGLGGNEGNNRNALTVEKAIKAKSAGLVIGSPIMGAADQRKAAVHVIEQILDETEV